MATKVSFVDEAWEDYLYWQANDKAILKRVNVLIKECLRAPQEGIGKPEALKFEYAGWWSRRITEEHRLVYRFKDDVLEIAQCRYHY